MDFQGKKIKDIVEFPAETATNVLRKEYVLYILKKANIPRIANTFILIALKLLLTQDVPKNLFN